ncbi:putative Regulator of Vps4 activity in the MVB pathway protein [Quillaja saponaria]|uniref:Regulator of Vps4 activity in the MVB pathway protein n=1 Tax=Quillaja saponaria TaxID=32244 RepID=A0AAD7KYK6_QUISA|nr:putative Regulator of Vps4 activity in the MVB pathway protein [Quillaja saponaria]KAJ7948289.1 putative Regulator of Vps4 activity in the MVB pathway protein [Quillaja saponaria]
MFDILFGWRKASKCKKLIKRVQCRLNLLKNKRNAIVRQLREDVAELIKNGHEETAFNRVEQLIKDECIATVYELLNHFCEFILIHLSYIQRHKDCPNDVNEAVSSLIFASARCGDLPELRIIRKLFGERYGHKFAMTAVELFPGNLVNPQIKEKLSIKSVADELKYRVIDEISRDYCLQPKLLALEYYSDSDWHQVQMKENNGNQVEEMDAQTNDTSAGFEMQPSNVAEIEREVICVDSSIKSFLTTPSNSFSNQSSDMSNPSSVHHAPPYISISPLHEKVDKVEKFVKVNSSSKFTVSSLEDKEEKMAAASSTESSPPFPEEAVVYLDDIEECQSSVSQEQRLFKFRSSGWPGRDKVEFGSDQGNIGHDESLSDKSDTMSSRNSRRTVPEKRSRRRSVSLENHSIKDVGCMIYYCKTWRSPSTHKHGSHYCRKLQRPLGEENQQSNCDQKRLKQHQSLELNSNFQARQSRHGGKKSCYNLKINDCTLEHPCYRCVFDDKNNWEYLPVKQKRGIRTVVGFPTSHVNQETLLCECCQCHSLWNKESDEETESDTLPHKPRRRSYHNGAVVYNVFTYLDYQSVKKNKAEISNSLGSPPSNCSEPDISSSLTRKDKLPPYSRAVTMPPGRSKGSPKDNIWRTNSSPFQNPNHVHPKLPEYDDIATKFMALKKEHLQNKTLQ